MPNRTREYIDGAANNPSMRQVEAELADEDAERWGYDPFDFDFDDDDWHDDELDRLSGNDGACTGCDWPDSNGDCTHCPNELAKRIRENADLRAAVRYLIADRESLCDALLSGSVYTGDEAKISEIKKLAEEN